MKTTIKLLLALAMIICVSCSKKDDVPTLKEQSMALTISGIGDLYLAIDALVPDRAGVWIDLNNNGQKDNGEDNIQFGVGATYTTESKTITIYGKITMFDCADCSQSCDVRTIDVSNNPSLKGLACYGNEIYGEAMTSLMNSLPKREKSDNAKIWVIATHPQYDDYNVCTKAQVKIATDKNWTVLDLEDENGNYNMPYEGS